MELGPEFGVQDFTGELDGGLGLAFALHVLAETIGLLLHVGHGTVGAQWSGLKAGIWSYPVSSPALM